MPDARFEFFEDDAGEHRFRLRAGNGEILVTSEGYTTETDARRGVEDFRENVSEVDASEVEED